MRPTVQEDMLSNKSLEHHWLRAIFSPADVQSCASAPLACSGRSMSTKSWIRDHSPQPTGHSPSLLNNYDCVRGLIKCRPRSCRLAPTLTNPETNSTRCLSGADVPAQGDLYQLTRPLRISERTRSATSRGPCVMTSGGGLGTGK